MCGDLNVSYSEYDVTNPNSKPFASYTPEEKNSFNSFLSSGWVDTYRELHPKVRQFTYWSYRANCREKNIGGRLDYFIISDKSRKAVKSSEINDKILGSDHCPLELQINIEDL